jgi:hypothetical protein
MDTNGSVATFCPAETRKEFAATMSPTVIVIVHCLKSVLWIAWRWWWFVILIIVVVETRRAYCTIIIVAVVVTTAKAKTNSGKECPGTVTVVATSGVERPAVKIG